jgi:predicted CXXCH cytochrome family protein
MKRNKTIWETPAARCGFGHSQTTTGINAETTNKRNPMKLKKILLTALLAGAAMAFMPSTVRATIIGSTHDFSPTGAYSPAATNGYAHFKWGGETNYYNNPCQVCHIPHKAQNYSSSHAPLWNHKLSSSVYVTYDANNSATFKGGAITLGSSIACLSCHDGSVAVNQTSGYSGTSATNSLNGTAYFAPSFSIETVGGATDLRNMHPIGVSYTACQANGDSELQDTSYDLLPKMLKGTAKTVECASCHDIHQTTGASATVSHSLIVDLEGGALCLECHKK